MSYILLKDDDITTLARSLLPVHIIWTKMNVARSDLFSIELLDKSICHRCSLNNLTDNNKKSYDTVMARAIEFINNKSRSNSSFIFPFFVRYAYRLYDGNYTMHSNSYFNDTIIGHVQWPLSPSKPQQTPSSYIPGDR